MRGTHYARFDFKDKLDNLGDDYYASRRAQDKAEILADTIGHDAYDAWIDSLEWPMSQQKFFELCRDKLTWELLKIGGSPVNAGQLGSVGGLP